MYAEISHCISSNVSSSTSWEISHLSNFSTNCSTSFCQIVPSSCSWLALDAWGSGVLGEEEVLDAGGRGETLPHHWKWGLSTNFFHLPPRSSHSDSPICPARSHRRWSRGYRLPWCLGSNAISNASPTRCLLCSVHVTTLPGLVLPCAYSSRCLCLVLSVSVMMIYSHSPCAILSIFLHAFSTAGVSFFRSLITGIVLLKKWKMKGGKIPNNV